MRNVNKIILISIAAHILICYTIVFGLYKLIRNRGIVGKKYYNLYTYELKSNQSLASLLRPLIHDEKTLP